MNGPEKNILYLAICLLIVGVVVRILPWGLPSIDSFQVESGFQGFLSNLEYAPQVVPVDSSRNVPAVLDSTLNKVTESPVEAATSETAYQDPVKTAKKAKKTKKVVKLPLHINTASVEELCALNGVGPKLAEKIVAYREAKGPIKNAADLKKVPGIGAKKLEGILPGVIFD